jgi:hypothetical protein
MSVDNVFAVLLLVIDDVPFASHWMQWAARDVSGSVVGDARGKRMEVLALNR